MIPLLEIIASDLRKFSESLEKKSILLDHPWALIDEEFEMQKLIFRRNKQLILAKNGIVQEGTWEYFPEARSLLIDRNVDKILCNEVYIDRAVMILKLDGTQHRFFVLANENYIPDLDVIGYLKKLRRRVINISELHMDDGRIFEVSLKNYGDQPSIGDFVNIGGIGVQNGLYKTQNNIYLELKNSAITKIFFEKTYINPDGVEITIQQKNKTEIYFGDNVFIDGQPAVISRIDLDKSRRLVIKDGKVFRVKWRNPLLGWFF